MKRKYSAALLDNSEKTLIARLCIALKSYGITQQLFLKILNDIDVDVDTRTMDRWKHNINNGIDVISTEKNSGRISLLDREQLDVAAGFVLSQNIHGKPVHVIDYQKFVKDSIGVELSDSTARSYLKADGFSYKSMKNKGKSFSVDTNALTRDLWNWVQKQDFTTVHTYRQRLASIDFTFTSHRTEKISGFAVTGADQPMSNISFSLYTNCIVTCLWSDGKNRTPSMLFTYNPSFRRDRNPTDRRDEQIKHLDECLKEYSIASARIIYIGKQIGESRKYAAESAEILKQFFKHYEVPRFTTILSDNGNSFFEDGSSVLEGLGFRHHITYPSNVHQYLSPNDNKLHGAAKKQWRSAGIGYDDDVRSSLYLLHQLDQNSVAHSRHWFNQNMLELKEEDVGKLINETPEEMSILHRKWIKSYRLWTNQDLRGDIPVLHEHLNDTLDGDYWQ